MTCIVSIGIKILEHIYHIIATGLEGAEFEVVMDPVLVVLILYSVCESQDVNAG